MGIMTKRIPASPLTRSGGLARRSGGPFTAQEMLEPLEDRRYLVADPVTISHPVWFANYTPAVTVNGKLNEPAYAASIPIIRAQANRAQSQATLRILYNEKGITVGVDVRDQYLWADGSGAGSGNPWDFGDDDSLVLYFDPSNTRKRFMTPAGRALALNLGKLAGPFTGSGVVGRRNWLVGNNTSWGTAVNWNGAPGAGIRWMTKLQGTPNNNADLDTGWTTEVQISWAALGMTAMPRNGQAITMNFQVIFDDTGGTRDHATNDASADPNKRFGPRIVDDEIQGVSSSFNVGQPGFEGPMNYAQLVFIDPRAAEAPKSVGFAVTDISGYGAYIRFNSPATSQFLGSLGVARRGPAASYEIVVSDWPLVTEDDWNAATPFTNTYVPKPVGRPEAVRISGLEPGSPYYIGLRAVDAAGRKAPFTSTFMTTLTTDEDTTGGLRVVPSPAGGTLATENGDPFIAVGSSAVPNNLYVRNLYPGDVWASGSNRYVNFSQTPGREGDASGYFDALADSGVTVLRVPLEWIALEAAGQGDLPRGMYWMEYPAGNYNPDMRTYLDSMIAEAFRTNIKLILHPFSTFNYRAYFNLTPYSTANGGPISSIDDFFQSPGVLNMAIDRVKTIIDWVNQSGTPEAVMGIELVNEWDDWTWTLNPKGNLDPSGARVDEMRDRAKFITRLAAAADTYDPRINIISSSIGLTPRGPVARALFTSDAFDILAPHYYTNTTSEPINSPDANKSIRPVSDYAGLAGYWTTQRRDNRPVYNGEWGLVRWLWPGGKTYYTGVSPGTNTAKPWTVANDVDLYRTTAWTSLVMGMAGPGLRLGGQEMRDLVPDDLDPDTTGYLPLPLPQGMRDVGVNIQSFYSDFGIDMDWNTYDASPLAGRVKLGNTSGKTFIPVGSTTGDRGMVYLVQDLNRSSGTAPGMTMTIDGLRDPTGFGMAFEFWSTDGLLLDRIDGVNLTGGKATVTLPAFSRDVVVKFAATLV